MMLYLFRVLVAFLILVGPVLGQPSVSQPSNRFVLANGWIHTAKEDAFQGYVVVSGTTIEAVGRGTAPVSVDTIDLLGQHLYPGLIDADSALGLVDVESLRASQDQTEVGKINPNLEARYGFRAESDLIPVARSQGVLVSGVNPLGGMMSGQGTVMRLWGWTWEEMTLRPTWALALDWPTMSWTKNKDDEAEKDRLEGLGEDLYLLSESLAQARAYSGPRADVKWEALKPYATGSAPILVRVDGASEIEAALAWGEREKLRMILQAGRDIDRYADQLAKRKIPVIYSALNSVEPRYDEPVDRQHRTPAILAKAGVLVALSPSGWAFDVRELRDLGGKTVGHGWSRLQALQSITYNPAKILGIDDRFGTIEPGKEATLILCDGDLLETIHRVVRAWGAGAELSLDDRQKQLYQKYRGRPQKSHE